MSDTETELETLNRLETALARIGAALPAFAHQGQTQHGPAQPGAAAANPHFIATLDQVIATLRAALNEPDIDEGAP
ncbi:hypothetical protein ACOSOMT5_P1546 [Acidiphilium sp. MT5]|jgi:hypothetical protein